MADNNRLACRVDTELKCTVRTTIVTEQPQQSIVDFLEPHAS